MKIVNCKECAKQLNDEEIHYYENRCEQCEGEWSEEITAWRKGGENEKLDRLYGQAKPNLH